MIKLIAYFIKETDVQVIFSLKCARKMIASRLYQIIAFTINLFINGDATRFVMHCGLSRAKNTIYKPLSLEGYTIQEKYCDERFLSYNGDMSINFLSILCHQFARMA